jgi:hypothetical protein
MHPTLILVFLGSAVLCSSSPEPDPALIHHSPPPALHYATKATPDGFCSNGGHCLPPVVCAPQYLQSLYDPTAACSLAPGTPGVCCPARIRGCRLPAGV